MPAICKCFVCIRVFKVRRSSQFKEVELYPGCACVRSEDVALINKINPVETPLQSFHVQIWRDVKLVVVSGGPGVVDTDWFSAGQG